MNWPACLHRVRRMSSAVRCATFGWQARDERILRRVEHGLDSRHLVPHRYYDERPGGHGEGERVEKKGSTISVGAPSIFELFAGVALSRKSEEERSKIMSAIASLPQLPLDFPSARAGGQIYARNAKSGSTGRP